MTCLEVADFHLQERGWMGRGGCWLFSEPRPSHSYSPEEPPRATTSADVMTSPLALAVEPYSPMRYGIRSAVESVIGSPAVSTSSATFSVQQSPAVGHWIPTASPLHRSNFIKAKRSLFGTNVKTTLERKLKSKDIDLATKRSTISRLKRKLMNTKKHKKFEERGIKEFNSKDAAVLCNMQFKRKRQPWTKDERKFSSALFLKSPSPQIFIKKYRSSRHFHCKEVAFE
ncbi:hypothetical protein J6590_083937 [Homalodisca vitripennis]|nr:hypothetical protein J6590_083937 [Homalodisca vitripennis]